MKDIQQEETIEVLVYDGLAGQGAMQWKSVMDNGYTKAHGILATLFQLLAHGHSVVMIRQGQTRGVLYQVSIPGKDQGLSESEYKAWRDLYGWDHWLD